MKVFLRCVPEEKRITITFLSEPCTNAPPKGLYAARRSPIVVRPGGQALGIGYEDLIRLETGRYEYEKGKPLIGLPMSA